MYLLIYLFQQVLYVSGYSILVYCQVSDTVHAFRLYKESRQINDLVSSLISAVRTYPVSTAECERGFNCMNRQQTATRNLLGISTLK